MSRCVVIVGSNTSAALLAVLLSKHQVHDVEVKVDSENDLPDLVDMKIALEKKNELYDIVDRMWAPVFDEAAMVFKHDLREPPSNVKKPRFLLEQTASIRKVQR